MAVLGHRRKVGRVTIEGIDGDDTRAQTRAYQQPAPLPPPFTALGVTPPSDPETAGWHPDPTGRHQLRYFDGIRWTDHVANSGQQATDPMFVR